MKVKSFFTYLPVWTFFLFLSVTCGDNKNGNSDGNQNGETEEETESGDVTVYLTSADKSNDFKKTFVSFNTGGNVSPTSIALNPAVKYQTMDGFGAALTGSACYNLLKMKPEDRTKFLKETFSETEGMGYSYVRIAIGCSDFSLSEYTCCDAQGIENFALTPEETDYVIPVLREVLAIQPKLKIMGSPWTCPRWMKVENLTNLRPYNSWTSGQLNPAYYQDYATYFVKWIQAFEGAGIKIYSVTPQNEPLNRGNSASLYMGWEEQRDFLKDALLPAFKEAALTTKIYLFDHNYNYDNMAPQSDYPVRIYSSGVTEGIAGAAYHNYGGDKSELLDIQQKYPDKELVFTETSIGTWNDGHNLGVRLLDDMAEVALGTVNNWCKAVIVWNLMLDSDRGPNRDGGCQTCYGAVDIAKSDYKTVSRNSHYYIIGHLSAVALPGATRIGTSGFTSNDLIYTAFENTDGSYAFVALNNSAESRRITLDDGNHHFSHEIPSTSVVSYKWKK
jgi:glucosylceramidase